MIYRSISEAEEAAKAASQKVKGIARVYRLSDRLFAVSLCPIRDYPLVAQYRNGSVAPVGSPQ